MRLTIHGICFVLRCCWLNSLEYRKSFFLEEGCQDVKIVDCIFFLYIES